MSISNIIFLLGQRLVAASENIWIQTYELESQKKNSFSLFFKKI